MRKALPRPMMPAWLNNLTADEIMTAPFPLGQLLQDSLYYPSSAFDGEPIRHLVGNFFSFVYVDYGYTEEQFRHALGKGFNCYEVIASRSVMEHELAPNGWRLPLLNENDGEPGRCFDHIAKKPFCIWSVLQRSPHHASMNISYRYSLLYLCADAVAAFHALYIFNRATPKAVAIIQPGEGFGRNWTSFGNPDAIFSRSVHDNPYGQPDYLLYGGWHESFRHEGSCWPDYSQFICHFIKTGDRGYGSGHVNVWAKQSAP